MSENAAKVTELEFLAPTLREQPDGSEAHPKGAWADIRSGVDISKVQKGYFSCPENIGAFLDLGIRKIEQELPEAVRYADFGGGQGFLTKHVTSYLESQGHKVHPIVVDANESFLDKAEKEGLRTFFGDLEFCELLDLDLVTMRAVNHYNAPEKQLHILDNVCRALGVGGYLVSQISSASEKNCSLRSELSNLESLGRTLDGQVFHWATVEEYLGLLKKAGFSGNCLVGYAPPSTYGPEEQWSRFNSKAEREAEAKGDHEAVATIALRKEVFCQESYRLLARYSEQYQREELGIEYREDGTAVIHYQYPIIVSEK